MVCHSRARRLPAKSRLTALFSSVAGLRSGDSMGSVTIIVDASVSWQRVSVLDAGQSLTRSRRQEQKWTLVSGRKPLRLIVGAGRGLSVQADRVSAKHVPQNHYALSCRADANRHADIVGEITILEHNTSGRDLHTRRGRTPGKEPCDRKGEQAAVGPGNRLVKRFPDARAIGVQARVARQTLNANLPSPSASVGDD